MAFGGNNRAQVFFKQHGWTDGGKIEAKYTSRAANLYRQILTKEVAKSMAEDGPSPPSPMAAEADPAADELPDIRVDVQPKESSSGKPETPAATSSPRASHTVLSNAIKKPLGARKGGKTGGLGARKLTSKPSENLYDQKPEEPAPPALTASISTPKTGPSVPSRFEYVDSLQATEPIPSGPQVISHVTAPMSSTFFADFGMDSGYQKKGSSNSSKVQESDEARKKFTNAKSISSAQFFGDQTKSDLDSQVSLQKFSGSSAISSADLFGNGNDHSSVDLAASDLINRLSFQAQQDISSIKNIAGETGKKLTSFASTFINDLQDRIL